MEMTPLNIFQRCMRVWEEAHPYNAAQVMHLEGDADVARINDAWNEVLVGCGLGTARVVGRRFRYERPARQDVTVVEAGLGFEQFITREINRPFIDAGAKQNGTCTSMPFRPFVLPGKGAHYLGVVYQHWVADSVALRMLLREWFCQLHDPAHVTGRRLDAPQGGFWRYFGPDRCGWHPVEGAMSLLHSMTEFSRARRIEEENGGRYVECSLHRLADGMVDALLQAARRRRATLNDVFLAALARACDEHGAAPRRSRRDMALGTIVDLRATSPENMENTFGMFLGFMAQVVRRELLQDRDRLLASIAAENAHQKECRGAQVSMLRMTAGYVQSQLLSQQQLAAFYRNYMPISGGVSNVNMNRSWPAEYHPSPLLDYIRIAPTGPMVPVVIAITTIGRQFTFVLTRRASLVDAARGAQLAQTFIEELTALAKTG